MNLLLPSGAISILFSALVVAVGWETEGIQVWAPVVVLAPKGIRT